MAAALLYSSLKGKPSENLFYKTENESENMLFQNLKPPPANSSLLLAKQAISAQPMSPAYSPPPLSPAYGDQLEFSTLSPGIQDQPWFGLKPYRESLLEQGSFPCVDILYEALMQMTNQLGFYGCTIQTQLQICLIGKTITLLTKRLLPPSPCDWTLPFCLCHSPPLLGRLLHSWIWCFLGMRGGWSSTLERKPASLI